MSLRILTGCALFFLLAASGCGTRSIVVPVHRPAAVDLHGCTRVAVAVPFAPQPDSLSVLLQHRLDAQLVTVLADTPETEFVRTPRASAGVLTVHGTVALREAAGLARSANAECLLLLEVMETSYREEILDASIRSMRDPERVKRVRQGRANATCRIMLIDVAEGKIPFVENMSVESRHETHSVEQDPPALITAVFAEDLARQIVEAMRSATRPVTDRELVTFLVDGDYPLIETAIQHAEEGRWTDASTLLRRMIDEDGDRENADILWYDLGLTLQYQQNFSGALEAFRRALALRQRSRYHRAVENLLRAEQEYLDALERR
ncbi:MAG: tetratricopeptide repeat protein [Bacteroidota bacterium]|nr:tetratricopeptide repeat protein [Bacteroidota bacterium]